jgi:membrane-bound lytic murein transglycosylase D
MKLFVNILTVMILCLATCLTMPAMAQAGRDGESNAPVRTLASAENTDNFSNLFIHQFAAAGDPGMMTLNPKAIPFVRDYLDDNYDRLQKMKDWGDPYFQMIEKILVRYNLPPELKYLAVIESDLKSDALSWAGARGPWQLMPQTGRDLGLKVGRLYDERTNLVKSTHAAAKYLRDLYGELGDWLLVIAAYNGGQARVEYAIRRTGSRDFWRLQYSLPAESRNHVKKFIATHYIMEGQGGETTTGAGEKKKWSAAADSALMAGTVTKSITGKYQSLVVAKWLSMDIQAFNRLNPRFDLLVTSEEYTLRLPADKMEYFIANRMQILSESIQFLLSNQPDEAENFPQQIRMLDLKRSNASGQP